MNWKKCLRFRFRACSGLFCSNCTQSIPTPEEFNQMYVLHQEWVQKVKEEYKKCRHCKRKWKKWDDKRLQNLYRRNQNAGHLQAD